jgi:hypothetical protein
MGNKYSDITLFLLNETIRNQVAAVVDKAVGQLVADFLQAWWFLFHFSEDLMGTFGPWEPPHDWLCIFGVCELPM